MNRKEVFDLNIALEQAIKLLNEKKAIKKELIFKGKAGCSIKTDNYELSIEIKKIHKED